MKWYGMTYDMIYDVTRQDMIQYDIWYGMIHDMTQHDTIRCDMIYDMIAQKLPLADTDHHSHSESACTMPRCYLVSWSQFCCHSEAAAVKFHPTKLQILFKTNDLYFSKST